jgi:predicted alpha/beta hydrolase
MSTTFALGSGPYRAASLRQVLARRLSGWGRAVWATLEGVGQRRAATHMRQWAAMHPDTHPELAAALRRAASSQG